MSGAEEVTANWDQIKQQEEKRTRAGRSGVLATGDAAPSALDGVPFGQSALALAAQLKRRAARAGVPEELGPLDRDAEAGNAEGPRCSAADREDIGGELFWLVARARQAGLEPEMELRAVARRYRDLVQTWERSGEPASRDPLAAGASSMTRCANTLR